MKPFMRRSCVVIVCFLASAVAHAAPAVVTTDLNLRAGQGTRYAVVGVMPQGAVVDVVGCADGWCYVRDYGAYASARYLDRLPRYAPRPYYRRPGFSVYIGPPRYRYWGPWSWW